ncbi:hypothetical protein VNO80_06786 [Phaseolus coccineus]|uniref:Uncharacterized protein n=1 Tax=Phaseolus coccineus TaxID=3886 RepID=A0AAN9NHH0_PHACN
MPRAPAMPACLLRPGDVHMPLAPWRCPHASRPGDARMPLAPRRCPHASRALAMSACLSRPGDGKKKEGNAATFVIRSQALKQLQISLPLFRAIRVHERKIKKAEAKKNHERANSLREKTPKVDRIIRQRYPRFVDALGELDYCLTMVHLFAALPASENLYALSRYVSSNTRPSVVNSEASQAESDQAETKQEEAETGNETAELRLAQLQHQLPSNEPGALMHLVEEVTGEDEEDQDTKQCKRREKGHLWGNLTKASLIRQGNTRT